MTDIELIVTTASITLLVCMAIVALVIVARIGRPQRRPTWTYHTSIGEISGDDVVELLETGRRFGEAGSLRANRELTVAEARQALEDIQTAQKGRQAKP